jgi:putative transposase
MVNYRRNRIPGGTYFFTVNLLDRESDLLVQKIDILCDVVRKVRHDRPFHIDAWVVLPDHLHCVWTLPPGDADYASRWQNIKKMFSRQIPATEPLSETQARLNERSIWQRRYWEHTIRDERDYAAHVDYCHINPLKHGLVAAVRDWPFSTFHRYVRESVYTADWAEVVPDLLAGERKQQT